MTDAAEHAGAKAKALEAVTEIFRVAFASAHWVDETGLLHPYDRDEVNAKAAAFLEVLIEVCVGEMRGEVENLAQTCAEMAQAGLNLDDEHRVHAEWIGRLLESNQEIRERLANLEAERGR